MTSSIRDLQTRASRARRRGACLNLLPNRLASPCGSLLACATLIGVLMGSTALPAWADGGAGGNVGVSTGGAGGAGFTGNPGGNSGSVAGGGGGGAGGGTGGSSSGIGAGGGGAGGTVGTPDGQAGGDATAAALGGGGGGGGGYNGNGAGAATITNSSPLAGGNGGRGGNGPSAGIGGGGGGGAGGYGAIATSNGASSNTSTISGGKGGAGGASGAAVNNHGGNGGDGGVGIQFTTTGVTFTNSGTVTGGAGGAAGAAVSSGIAGAPGAGGVGIIGSSLSIINSGTIAGGLSGDNATRANAITFTGGTNVLELQAGSAIFGNVVDPTSTGTLRLSGSTNFSFDASAIGPAAQYQGFSTFVKTGTSTWTLTGATAAVTPWNINQGTLAILNDNSLGATSGGLTFDGGTLQFQGPTVSNRDVTLNAGGGTFFTVNTNATLGGNISGSGALTKAGLGILTLSGASSYTGATNVALGTLQAGAANTFASGSAFTISSGGVLDLNNFDQALASLAGAGNVTLGSATLTVGSANTSTTLFGGISGTGGLTKVGTGTFTLSGTNSYTGATNINVGTLQAGAANAFAPGSAFTVASGAFLDLNGFNQSIGSLAGAGDVTLGAGTLTTGNDNSSTNFTGGISGTGGLTKAGSGIFTLSGTSGYTGATNVNAGTLQAGAANVFALGSAFSVASGATLDLNNFNQSIGSLAGAGAVTLGTATLTTGNDNTSTSFSGGISGTGGLTKLGSGTFTMSGTSSYIGPTDINAGTLLVNGSVTGSAFTVNSGATLGGTGTVGATTVANGGTLAPGNSIGTLNVNGTLTFNSGSTYAVEVSPSSSDKTIVSGTASLAGTAQATFLGGSYMPKSYTILTSAGLGVSTFDTFTTVGLPSGFSASLSYTPTDALLNLTATLGLGSSLNGNQQNVAGAINAFFNGGGALPPSFLAIFNLTGADLRNALTELSGESATGAQRGAFLMMGQFLGLMLDPFVDGRNVGGFGPGRLAFSDEQSGSPNPALAYGPTDQVRPRLETAFDRRWSVWGSGFGGSNNAGGDPVVGSHDITASTYGVAVGLDYRFSPDTVAGIAVAGGGTSWGLASGLGGGSSDAFQIGAYSATRSGPAYLAASLGFANHWVSTNRDSLNGDRISGRFTGQSFGARFEGGARYGNLSGGITPYVAVQGQSFQAPAYNETDIDSGGFALHYNSKDATDVRTELGTRFDAATALDPRSILTLRSRLAWAHDWVSDPSLRAVFQALPGASFIVNGAPQAKDYLLASTGFELRLTSGVTVLAKFDGEFGNNTQTYSGTGTLRYTW